MFLTYDVTNRKTFEGLKDWINGSKLGKNCIVVGNKIDLLENRQVQVDEGYNLAKTYGFKYHEISVKDNIGLVKAFEELFEQSYLKKYVKSCEIEKANTSSGGDNEKIKLSAKPNHNLKLKKGKCF